MVVGADADVTEDIPLNPLTQPYYEYFGPEHRLNLHTTREVQCHVQLEPCPAIASLTYTAQLDHFLEDQRQAASQQSNGALRAGSAAQKTGVLLRTLTLVCIRAVVQMVDENVRADLERIKMTVFEQLRQLESAPGMDCILTRFIARVRLYELNSWC